MNMLETLSSTVLAGLVLSSITHIIPVIQKKLAYQDQFIQEIADVEFAMQVMARGIRQAGFGFKPNPWIGKKLQSPTPKEWIPIQILKNSTLKTGPIGAGIASSKNTQGLINDAMILSHIPFGHFDCLGRKITPNRTNNGLAHLGFFIQQDSSSEGKAALMCQSLDQKGVAQNDAILAGIKHFELESLPPSTRDILGIQIKITTQSGRLYEQIVALRNTPL
jgi:hypothetical protein